MSETKFCKDCKFCKRSLSDFLMLPIGISAYRYAKCIHPRLGKDKVDSVWLVTGRNPDKDDDYCSVERKEYGMLDTCGPEGKYFEAKK